MSPVPTRQPEYTQTHKFTRLVNCIIDKIQYFKIKYSYGAVSRVVTSNIFGIKTALTAIKTKRN